MPEGQVSHRNAIVLTRAIAGDPLLRIEAPEPRLAPQRIPDRLMGDVLDRMEARGKHHLFHFRSGRVLHSHLRMGGVWRAYPADRAIPRGGLWLALGTGTAVIAQYRGPVLTLLEPGDELPQVDALGPDLLAADADPGAIGARLRSTEPTRQVGDAIMDQRVMSGIGNVYKSETLFLAGIDPWRAVGALAEGEANDIARIGAELLAMGVRDRGRIITYRPPLGTRHTGERTWVYGRRGRPCRQCGAPIRSRGQGDANRTTYWCPRCQA
jgi:endonuclease VIII